MKRRRTTPQHNWRTYSGIREFSEERRLASGRLFLLFADAEIFEQPGDRCFERLGFGLRFWRLDVRLHLLKELFCAEGWLRVWVDEERLVDIGSRFGQIAFFHP